MRKRQWVPFVLAIFVALIYGSHHFFVSRELSRQGLSYHPVTIASNRDEASFYGERVRAVFDGDWVAGDIGVAGREKSPSTLPILNPLLLGVLARIMGSPERAFIASDFLFPALIFLVLYFLAREISGRRKAALLFAVAFVFMPKIFLTLPPASPSLIREFTNALLPDPANLAYFSRFEYPKVTFLFFALALYFIVRAVKRDEKYGVWWAGLAWGILFYTYLFDWVYVACGIGLLGFVFLARKDYRRFRRMLAIFGIGLIVSIPYWINFFYLMQLPHYGEVSNRFGTELGRAFRVATAWKSYLRSAALAFLVWFLWRKRDRIATDVLLGFLPVIAIVLNLQLILGFNPQPDHWHRVQFLTVGLSFFLLGLWLYERYVRTAFHRRCAMIAVGAAIVLILGGGLYGQYMFSAAHAMSFTLPEGRAASYAWLDRHTPKRSVVGAISAVNSEIPLYTHNKVFLANGFNTTVSNAELLDRFMIMARVFGIGSGEFKTMVRQPDNVLYLFHDTYRDRSFDSYFRPSDHFLPEEVAAAADQAYEAYLNIPAGDLIGRYELEYLYFEEGGVGTNPLRLFPSLQTVYENGGIAIYKLKS